MVPIRDNEPLKAACHGLLLGCLLPVIAYNIAEHNWRNVATYSAFLVFEMVLMAAHVRPSQGD